MSVKVDDETIQITEFMSTPLNDGKLRDLYDYHNLTKISLENDGFDVKTGVLSIADPNRGKEKVDIDDNITFHVKTEFTKNMDGWNVLSTLENIITKQEELSGDDAIDLLIFQDMDIDMPIKALMSKIIALIGKAKFSDDAFKVKIILCECQVLARFFKGKELSEMIEMLKTETKNPEVERVIEKYGIGFDVIYFDGKADGFADGKADEKLEIAKNLIAEGCDEELISRCTGLSISHVRKLKRKALGRF